MISAGLIGVLHNASPVVAAIALCLVPVGGASFARKGPRRARASGRRGWFYGAGAGAAAVLFGLPWWGIAAACLAAAAVGARLRDRPRQLGVAEMRSLAATLDALAACLDAGMSPAGALSAIVTGRSESGGTHEALAQAASLMMLGGDPAQAWRPVAEIAVLSELAAAAQRSVAGGVRLAGAARDTADALRARCRAMVSAQAARAGVAMTAPLAVCFLPAFLCLGLAPTVWGLVTSLHLW